MIVRPSTWPAFGIIIVSIAYVVEITTFPLILGSLARSMSLTEDQALWLVSGYKIALVASLLVGGALGDRFGRERIFAIGTALFALSSLALLGADSSAQAFSLRLLQGIGAGLFSPMIPALLAARNPSDAVSALSRWGMITGVAAAIYPFCAALITQTTSWQMGWLIIPLLSSAALLGLPRRSAARVPDASPAKPTGWTISAPVWAIMAYVFVNYGLTTWFIYALAMPTGSDYSLTHVGISMFVLWSIFALGNLAIGRLSQRASMPALLYLGTGLNVAGLLILCTAPAALATYITASVVIGLGMALNNVPTTDLAFRMSPAAAHGRVASLDIIAARLGGAVFVLIVPLNLAAASVTTAVFSILVGILSVACIAFAASAKPPASAPPADHHPAKPHPAQ